MHLGKATKSATRADSLPYEIDVGDFLNMYVLRRTLNPRPKTQVLYCVRFVPKSAVEGACLQAR